MTVQSVQDVLQAQVLCGGDYLENKVHSACGSDLMSDVLAFVKDRAVLLTGMTNIHVVRTADMLDIACIVFVRGKTPERELLDMAVKLGIPVLNTPHTLFTACGMLYEAGLRGGRSRSGA